jgi:hypothetical protein
MALNLNPFEQGLRLREINYLFIESSTAPLNRLIMFNMKPCTDRITPERKRLNS